MICLTHILLLEAYSIFLKRRKNKEFEMNSIPKTQVFCIHWCLEVDLVSFRSKFSSSRLVSVTRLHILKDGVEREVLNLTH